MHRYKALLFVLLLGAAGVSAQTFPPTSDTWLMPVSPSVFQGGQNSLWQTVLYLANQGEQVTLDCDGCGIVGRNTATTFQREGPQNPGFIFNVPSSLQLSLRTVARNSAGREFVMEVPMARLSDFRNSTIRILGVPVGGDARTSLRIFDAEGRDNTPVRIRLFGPTGVIAEREVMLRTPTGLPTRFYPATLQIDDLVATFPDAATPGNRLGVLSFIEITPLALNSRIWALATATHNTTQQFNSFTP
jgi:hypothetical protein